MAFINIAPARDTFGTESFPEAASVAAKKGAPVLLNASGYLEECAAAPTVILGFIEAAGQNGTAAGDKTAQVYRALGNQFRATLTGTLAQSDLGIACGLIKDGTTSKWYLDRAAATKQCHIVKIPSSSTVGSTDQEVIFQVDTAESFPNT